MPIHPYLDAPAPLAFAHRGGAAEGDENTTAAFERAVTLGFRYVETDVHATRDGVPVVFHDTTLTRLTGAPDRIADLTWPDLESVRIAGAAAVPRLDEVLDAWPRIHVNIDVKADDACQPTVSAIRRSGAEPRILLASFSDARLAHLSRLAGPAVATSLGTRAVARLRVASLLGTRSRSLPPSAVAAQVPIRHGPARVVDRRFVTAAHRHGLQVHVWTIDDPTTMAALLDLGVDGIMTDHPEILRQVYTTRGLWHP